MLSRPHHFCATTALVGSAWCIWLFPPCDSLVTDRQPTLKGGGGGGGGMVALQSTGFAVQAEVEAI